MDDLDDLLGGPSNTNHQEIDDLLGDSKPTTAAANTNASSGGGLAFGGLDLDDDLLGGGPPSAVAAGDDDDLLGGSTNAVTSSFPSAPKPTSSTSSQPMTNRPDNRLAKDNSYSAQIGGRPRALGVISAPAVKDVPQGLQPFIGAQSDNNPSEVYFVRAVQIIETNMANMNHSSSVKSDGPTQRFRAVVLLTGTTVAIYSPSLYNVAVANGSVTLSDAAVGTRPVRTIAIEKIFGLVRQSVVVPKMFGAKETEEQILLLVKEESDVLIALTRENLNGPLDGPDHDNDLVQALSSVTYAHGMTLPISTLHEGEMIEKLVNRHVGKRGDEKLRHRQSEQLAFRTELTNERDKLKTEIDTMTVDIEKLKVSDIAKAADQIQADVMDHEKAILQFRKNTAMLEQTRRQLEGELEAITRKIQSEKTRRETAAKDTMAAAQHEAFKRQVAEFEQMKNAHKREMDKLSNLIAFAERRVGDKGKKTNFNGVVEISDRLEDLEAQDKFLSDNLAKAQANHARQMEVLAIAKKEVLPEGRTTLQLIVDEIKMLEQLKAQMDADGERAIKANPRNYAIPESINREKPKALEVPSRAVVMATPPPAPVAAPAAAPAGKGVVVLDVYE